MYLTYHSKGAQGQKRSVDRASGSGVFARDPDALLDMIELKNKGTEEEQTEANRDRTAWRVEGTMREFQRLDPVNIWFDYPIHIVDHMGDLKDVKPEGQIREKIDKAMERQTILETAYNMLTINDEVTIADVMEYTGLSRNTIRDYIDRHPNFTREDGKIIRLPVKGAE